MAFGRASHVMVVAGAVAGLSLLAPLAAEAQPTPYGDPAGPGASFGWQSEREQNSPFTPPSPGVTHGGRAPFDLPSLPGHSTSFGEQDFGAPFDGQGVGEPGSPFGLPGMRTPFGQPADGWDSPLSGRGEGLRLNEEGGQESPYGSGPKNRNSHGDSAHVPGWSPHGNGPGNPFGNGVNPPFGNGPGWHGTPRQPQQNNPMLPPYTGSPAWVPPFGLVPPLVLPPAPAPAAPAPPGPEAPASPAPGTPAPDAPGTQAPAPNVSPPPAQVPAAPDPAVPAPGAPAPDAPAPSAPVPGAPAPGDPALAAPESPASAAEPDHDIRPTSAEDGLPDVKVLSVIGGLVALALAGAASAAVSFQSAAQEQARIDAARAEFFGTGA